MNYVGFGALDENATNELLMDVVAEWSLQFLSSLFSPAR